MDLQRINALIKKYANHTATEEEEKELLDWYHHKSHQERQLTPEEENAYQPMLERLNKAVGKPARKPGYSRLAIAASFILLIGATVLVLFYKQGAWNKVNTSASIIAPGGNKAVLTLADGSHVLLNDIKPGQVVNQNGVKITKTQNGQLIYQLIPETKGTGGDTDQQALSYNSISTPIGGQYQVILPDGSRVWLNSMTTIKYPTSFAALNERRVELSGEAYFEVKHNSNQPFRVLTRGVLTEDLGTEFNINGYADEAGVRTTLINGSAKIAAGEKNVVLVPGEQASYVKDITVAKVKLDEVIAWKNGYFRFTDKNLAEIMKDISRWYDIKVVFTDETLKSESYGAAISRFTDLPSILKLLDQAGDADFHLEGHTLTISKKRNQ